MKLSERWLNFCKPYLDRLLAWARKDSDISHAEYEQARKEYEKLYGKWK